MVLKGFTITSLRRRGKGGKGRGGGGGRRRYDKEVEPQSPCEVASSWCLAGPDRSTLLFVACFFFRASFPFSAPRNNRGEGRPVTAANALLQRSVGPVGRSFFFFLLRRGTTAKGLSFIVSLNSLGTRKKTVNKRINYFFWCYQRPQAPSEYW